MIVLDTNVVSELMRPTPAPAVAAWVAGCEAATLFFTAVSEAELRYGVALMPAGGRREAIDAAIGTMLREDFAGRILPFDSAAAHTYAEIAASRRAAGHPISAADAQIAAIAHSRGMAVATRNIRDFSDTGIDLIDPWSGA